MTGEATGPGPLGGRYTMFSRIPLYRGGDGTVLADPLWAKDLERHLDYLPEFRIAAPFLDPSGQPGLAPVAGLRADRVLPIPHNVGWGQVLRNLVPTGRRVLAAARDSDIVHSGGAGWPFPLSFYLLAARPLIRARWVMVIESSFWRLEPGETGSLRARAVHAIWSRLLPACLRAADLRIFTQDEYRASLFGGHDAAHVSPAVWIDEAHVETDAGLAERRQAADGPPRAVFPARLVAEKGVDTVFDAVRRLEARLGPGDGTALVLDIMGEGAMAEDCRRFAEDHAGRVEIRWLPPLAYGAEFFAALRGYDALIVANRKAEQARILFDAMAQGVAVIASATAGTLDVVDPGRTALTFEVDDADGLAAHLETLIATPEKVRHVGAAGLEVARGFTHAGMHEKRRAFLSRELARLGPA